MLRILVVNDAFFVLIRTLIKHKRAMCTFFQIFAAQTINAKEVELAWANTIEYFEFVLYAKLVEGTIRVGRITFIAVLLEVVYAI
jgi:hypothetical protein